MLYEASLGTAGTSTVVRLAGEVTDRDVEALRALLDQAAALTSRRLVIDMHDAHSLSAAAVRCLAFVQQHLPATAEVVIDGASPELRERLGLAGLDRSMVIVPAEVLATA
ncbi:STAS domain-containing protein [Streptomyces sp. H27-C3]|uniref:STAS domain-containing protein n=1 Tax=Streptomyces sp. H27-C3 TaxID=3046305 RepID=UPI0024B968FC|nr:STAS domain-containing protein [Streptomyces sp. H27-C3]MDJ0466586.1 STAS domain-containing protein [Streptomyces sp. H27-C3]